MQEKETEYKGGIMAFVHNCFTSQFSNLGLKRRNGTWLVPAPCMQNVHLLMVQSRQNGSDARHNGHEHAWP